MRLWALLIPLSLAGCTERLLEIRSTPPAEVWIDGEKRGETPHIEKYVFYGTREIVLVKPGYRSHRKMLDLDAPWWQVFPFDFITDVLLPFTFTDHETLDVELEKEPAEAGGFAETLKRANEARDKANAPPDEPK
jgi:hypothetical protein